MVSSCCSAEVDTPQLAAVGSFIYRTNESYAELSGVVKINIRFVAEYMEVRDRIFVVLDQLFHRRVFVFAIMNLQALS